MHDQQFDEHVAAALIHRPEIEQAKGILMALRRATPEQAYAELAGASQNHNVKVREIAAALVEAVTRGPTIDHAAGQVVWQEWGRLLEKR